jgi:TFIIF-interacting CTD phosphatase-like protein
METTPKKLVLLDLDNTLICSEDLDNIKDSEALEHAKKHLVHQKMVNYYQIFERPHLQEFLSFLFENFKVGIWTASSKDYAIFIVKNFIIKDYNNRKLDLFLCSHHCNVSKRNYKGVSKHLNLLSDKWKLADTDNIILIDDLEELREKQENTVITVKPFFYNSDLAHKDKELIELTKILKKIK